MNFVSTLSIEFQMRIFVVIILPLLFLSGCNSSELRQNEILIEVDSSFGKSVITEVREDLREIAPSHCDLLTLRGAEFASLYLSPIEEQEEIKVVTTFNTINKHLRIDKISERKYQVRLTSETP